MEIALALLAFRADPNGESRAGFTPLHLAAEEGHVQMAALLVENGSQVPPILKTFMYISAV
jgi:ankyrin repeat protein